MSQRRAARSNRGKLRAALGAACKPPLELLERRLCLSGFFDIESDVSLLEGNGGVTNLTFTVTWNNPGLTDGNADVTVFTQDGSATVADNDYQPLNFLLKFQKPLFSTAPVTRVVTVPVVGDIHFETDEFFTLNLTEPSNAVIRASSRQGIIQNDDQPLVTGTAGNDFLVVNATGPNSGSFQLNGGTAVSFSGITSFTFNAQGGDDILRINNPAGNLFGPAAGIFYNGGGQAGDALENLGGTANSGTYRVGPSNDAGTLAHVRGPTAQTISFTGLAPVSDTVGEALFTVTATDASNTITLDNGSANGDGLLRIGIDVFEPVQFANKVDVVVNAGATDADLSDTVNVQYTESATGLSSVNFNGGRSNNIFNVRSTPPLVTTILNGDIGDDHVRIHSGPDAGGNLNDIAGPIGIGLGGGINNQIQISDASSNMPNPNVVVTSSSITGIAGLTNSTPINFAGALFSLLLMGSNNAGDTFTVQSTPASTFTRIFGLGGTDTLVGPGTGATWNITASNQGNVAGLVGDFQQVENLTGGSGYDRFVIANGGSVSGTINGGGGVNNDLDYESYTSPVAANLGLSTTGLNATLGGDQEVPANPSAASGTAVVTNYSPTTRTFDITVTVNGITPAQVSGFHVHRAVVGVNGPIIIDFMPGGVPIAPLLPTGGGNGFTFTATGVSLANSLLGGVANEAAFLGGVTYVNVQTLPTYPGGEIRGQLFSTGNVNVPVGTATGAGAVLNIQNVVGGPASDSLVGSFASNQLEGGGGSDTVLGGPGNDALTGEAAQDIMAWNNGDGSDVMEGAGAVQVNASSTANDNFTFAANGTRIDLDRVSPLPFSLDIGNVQTLIVNGLGGDDSFTVSSLETVAGLSRFNLYGQDGADAFVHPATSSPLVTYRAHGGPGGDILIGPDSNTNFFITGLNRGNASNLLNEFQFIESLRGGTANDTFFFEDGDGVTGTINGGAGSDTLSHIQYTSAIAVNLGANAPGLAATLGGDQVVPPRQTSANGAATLTYDNVARTFNISLTVMGIAPTQVTGLHIHRAALGVNGPIIIDFGPAPLVPILGGTGFTLTANNVPIDPRHEAALLGGFTSLDVHTIALPGGAIRGQIFPSGLFVTAPGTATGTAGITGIESVYSGSGSFTVGGISFGDGLVGDNNANGLYGGAGNDVLVGVRGNDMLLGEIDDDLIAWSNGDGTDLIEGGAGNDLVQVHGVPDANDVFNIAAGPGGRVDFDHLGPGPFSLDIGSTETLAVAGRSGDDTFTVHSLAGVADLALLRLAGLQGNDTFSMVPSPNVTIDVTGHSPMTPSQPGDTLDIIFAGATSPAPNFIHTPDGFVGSYTFGNRQPINFRQIETGLTPPEVIAVAFRNETAPHTLQYTFSQDIFPTLSVSDLTLRNTITGALLLPSQISLVQDTVSRTATFSFPAYGNPAGVLFDGRWEATLRAAGITNSLAIPLDGNGDLTPGDDHVFNFHHLTGDANGDAAVGFADLVVLAQNYNATNRTFSTGDFDYDTDVDFADLVLLAQRYNSTLAPRAAASSVGSAAAVIPARAPARGQTKPTPIFSAAVPIRRPPPLRGRLHSSR